MAPRSEVKIAPPSDPTYPKCPMCGWWDRKLRIVNSALTPEERIALHMWGRHDTPLPDFLTRMPEKE